MADSEKTGFDGFGTKAATEQFLKLMRSSFDATFENVVKIQTMNEKMLKDMIAKGKELQTDGVKAVDEFIANANKGRDEYKKAVEEGFKKVEQMMKSD